MKKLMLLLIPLFIFSCQDKQALSELNSLKAQLDEALNKRNLETQNKAIAQKIIDGLNQRDTSYIELYSPDCKYYFPSSNPYTTSREDDLNASKSNWRAIPDIHWKLEETIAEGDMVVGRFTAVGTPKEVWFGVKPSGKKFESGGIFILKVENRKIIEQWEDFDVLGTMTQLGMELKPSGKK